MREGLFMIFLLYFPRWYSGSHILLTPMFSRGVSVSLNLLFLFGLLISWTCKKIMSGCRSQGSTERYTNHMSRYHKQTFIYFLGLTIFNLVVCCMNYYSFYKGWSLEELMTFFDLVSKTLAILGITVYIQTQFSYSGELNFPFLLRIWWGISLPATLYILIIDIVRHEEHPYFPVHLLLSDIVWVILSLSLCYLGLFGKGEAHDGLLQENLLKRNRTSESNNNIKSKKQFSGDNITTYVHAGIFSTLSFYWMGPLFSVGNAKTLDLEDVPQLAPVDSASVAYPKFRDKLDSYCEISNGLTTLNLVKALIFIVRREVVLTSIFATLYTFASYVGPYLIDTFVQYLSREREFKNEGYVLVFTFFVAKLMECLSQRHWFFRAQEGGVRVRAALVALIYQKGLTLSCQSKQRHSSGEIINFMTVDAERVGDFSWYLNDPWLVILQVALALIILYKNLGVAAIAALFAIILFMLVNVPLGKLQEDYQGKLMESKDGRMKATSEILRNMRILKLQGWEMKFLSKIIDLRAYETKWLRKYLYTAAMSIFIFVGAPIFVSVLTFGTCMIIGIPLTSGKILSALATFRILKEPIYNLPDTISMIAQTKVSLDRIASFLRLDELQTDVVKTVSKCSSNISIEMVEGIFSWDLSSPNPTLKNMNFKVNHGMRVAVCGSVGSGKSSLISSILGEVPKISGIVMVGGSTAYVAQSTWIQSGKIEDNILFGKNMERVRYERVLEVCSLKKDLEILPFGDQTVIGERGINLSGGQKQRIQIARALYQDADIYLFDDPFSAVDAHTGSHLFKECLLGLLSSKTIVYVTHQVEFLPSADLILVLKDGRITQSGTYNEILSSNTDFMELVDAHKKALLGFNTINVGEEEYISVGNNIKAEGHDVNNNYNNSISVESVDQKRQLVQEEEREKGKVGFPVYWKFITMAYGGVLVPLIVLAMILFQMLQIASNYWMAWATPVSLDMEEARVKGSVLIIVYVALAIGSSFCVLLRVLLLATAGFKTATLLFNKMHHSIFRAPMSFFDTTPSGRILNRASTDQSTVDMKIPLLLGQFTNSMIQLVGIIVVMSQVAWQVFIVFIPVIAGCIWYQQYYNSAARELSRLVGVSKAPAIQHFAETISGLTTIRSFNQQIRFRNTNMKLTDACSSPMFHIAAAKEWLCFRLDMLSSITFAASLLFLISLPVATIDSAMAGLAVTYGLNLNMMQAWVIWILCNLQNNIISVERILQYTSIPSEPPLLVEENKPYQSWPSVGDVNICDLQVRYARHMPLVLRGLTCTFHGGLKTGIVGRTGSGKSTLIQTIFRIVDPSSGHILIDGIDISSIGLHDLRSKLSIIPQDPTMFEGTIRSNLDPLEEYTDEHIWETLDKCRLGEEVRKKERALDSTVSENGENWSMGQRQLVCLGRVLLKKSKVLVLDEATASVDTATDNLIQQTLSQHFGDSTVITIAHRISSVLHSDMVLLLDNGLIQEFDSPARLLQNKLSSFSNLVSEYTSRSGYVK